jgi:hypothetical protein
MSLFLESLRMYRHRPLQLAHEGLVPMNAVAAEPVVLAPSRAARYARCLKMSKSVEWQIDRDLIRGRELDFKRKFLPDGLSLVDRLTFLAPSEARFLSQIQGRTYAYLFGLVERFISAKMLDRSRGHALGDQAAFESLVRFSSEEIKHQELFRRMEQMIAPSMPRGYRMVADPNDVARQVLAASNWAVLAFTCHIELFVQGHYQQSIAPRQELCPLFKDIFFYHWQDECQHVLIDELEWTAEDSRITEEERDQAVDDFIGLIGATDALLQAQAAADLDYFLMNSGRAFDPGQMDLVKRGILRAYRWQYIVSGVEHVHFARLLTSMTTVEQLERIHYALTPVVAG